MADLARLGIIVDSSQVTRADQRLDNLTRTGRRTESGFRRFGQTATKAGRRLSIGLTAPLVAMGVASVKTASEFESSMTRINTLVGLSSERVSGMRDEVLALAGETAVAPRDLSEALFTITSAGARGSEALEILERSAKASAIGLGETKEIARATTAVLQAYGVENISASEATDTLTATIREGNLEASDLAPVLGRVIGIASQLGISFQEVGANIATFTRLGVGAEEAVTGLRGIMNALLKPSSEGARALAEVGMSFDDLRSKVENQGLAKTMIELVQTFEGNDEALSEIIPNVRALSNVLGTAGAQSEAYNQINENLADTLGIVDEGFATVSQTAGFKFQQTLSILKSTAIEVGSAFLPMATKIAESVQKALKYFNDLSDSGKNTAYLLAGLLGAGGPVLLALGALSTAIGAITAPIAGIALAVGTAGVLIVKNWSKVERYFTSGGGSEVFADLQETGSKALETLEMAFDLFVDVVTTLWDTFGEDLSESASVAWEAISGTVNFFLDRMQTTIKVWSSIVKGDFKGALNEIEEDFETSFDNIYRSVVNYFGEGGIISDPIFAWFERSLMTPALEALGVLDEEIKNTYKNFSVPPKIPEDIIIPAELPSVEELFGDLDMSFTEHRLEIPATIKPTIDLSNVPETRLLVEPFELLDRQLLGLPLSVDMVDEALDGLNDRLLATMNQAERESVNALIEQLEDLRDELLGTGEDAGKAGEELKKMDSLTRDLGFTFESAFEQAIIDGMSLGDVLDSLVDDIIRLTLRMTAVKPLADAFAGFLGGVLGGSTGGGETTSSARGNVFGGGRLIDKNETVSFANGGTGLFGEGASLEGVFPLTRLPNGDLGLKTNGGGGGGSPVNVTIINNANDTEVSQEETRRPDGGRDITVMIDEVVASKIRGGGKTAKALQDTFGNQRTPRLRG